MSDDNPELIEPPNIIATKVQKKFGTDPEEMLAEADAEVAKLAESFTDWIQDDVAKLLEALTGIRSGSDDAEKHMEDLIRIAHDMKGQGGSFGYGLVTRIVESLYNFAKTLERADEREVIVMEAHVDALKGVIHHDVRGDGGDLGADIVAGLQRAVQQVRP